MPIIPLKNDNFDFIRLSAVMHYPNDPQIRQHLFAAELKQFVLDLGDQKVPGAAELSKTLVDQSSDTTYVYKIGYGLKGVLNKRGHTILPNSKLNRRMLEAPRLVDLKKDEEVKARRGRLAGDLLLYVLLMMQLGEPRPSVRKAVHVVQYYDEMVGGRTGPKVGTTPMSLSKYWKEYLTVSHLWATMTICRLSNDPRLILDENSGTGAKLRVFLQISEWLRKFGERFVPSHLKSPKPIFPASRMWRVPDSMSIVPFAPLFALEESSWVLEALRSYKR